MRLVGAAERGIEMMRARALERVAFKRPLAQHGAFTALIAEVLNLMHIGTMKVLEFCYMYHKPVLLNCCNVAIPSAAWRSSKQSFLY